MPAPEIGYWLGVKYWGKGYATEAVRALIDHAFTELGHEGSSRRRASPIRRRAACWRSAASSGPARAWSASARIRFGADRPLPARPRALGLAQELGPGQAPRRSEIVSASRCGALTQYGRAPFRARSLATSNGASLLSRLAPSSDSHDSIALRIFVTERVCAMTPRTREEHRVVSCASPRRPQPRNETSGGDHDATGPVSPRNAVASVWAMA